LSRSYARKKAAEARTIATRKSAVFGKPMRLIAEMKGRSASKRAPVMSTTRPNAKPGTLTSSPPAFFDLRITASFRQIAA